MPSEYEFYLPCGFVDGYGQLHQYGRMRLALATDEMEAMQEANQRGNLSYLPVHLLARVITQLGTLGGVTSEMLERFFAADIAYLSDLYLQLNSPANMQVNTACPHCHYPFELEIATR